MYACDDNDDCRDSYACLAAKDLGETPTAYTISDDYAVDDDAGVDLELEDQSQEDRSQTVPLARNLDKESAKFCTVRPVDRKE